MDNQKLIIEIDNQISELQKEKKQLEKNSLTSAEKTFLSNVKTSKTNENEKLKNLSKAEQQFINNLKN